VSKLSKILMGMALLWPVSAFSQNLSTQIQPILKIEITKAMEGCINVSAKIDGRDPVIDKTLATAALPQCYESLQRLDTIGKQYDAVMTPMDKNYFFYEAGNAVWLVAGNETLKNNNNITPTICALVYDAEAVWGQIRVVQGSPVLAEMQNNVLRSVLLPACQANFPPQQ